MPLNPPTSKQAKEVSELIKNRALWPTENLQRLRSKYLQDNNLEMEFLIRTELKSRAASLSVTRLPFGR